VTQTFVLPWNLAFEPVPGLATAFDAVTGRLDLTLTNAGETRLTPGDLVLRAKLDLPVAAAWAWIHGRYMQTDAFVREFGEPSPEGYDGRAVREGDGRRTYVSREMAVLSLPTKSTPALLLGCLRMDRFFCDIEFDVDPGETRLLELRVIFDLEGTVIAPGEALALPSLLIRDGADAIVLAESYADAVAAEMGARVRGHVPTGWCSWYYFYNRVSEADVLANLEEMRRGGHPAEYVQIDDGFQSHTGDWLLPNEKFPSGMAALAAQIREAGYRPGLWLAPFVLHEDSAALRDHPEMVLKQHDGSTLFVQTWLGRCAVLDCTNPESEAWLRHTVNMVVREWGYEYLKLDALAFAACSGTEVRYHAPDTTAPANLRRGLEIIREAAGDETFILGCTCHFGPAVGLVDAMRVGPDVKEVWAAGPNPSVRHAMRLTLQRNWMHNRWWVNDPDCLIVRETDTELNEAEVRFLATGIALSGGMVVASDDLPKLSESRRALALALFPPAGVAARPVHPGEAPVASAWRADVADGRALVGILNWGDEGRWVVVAEYLRPGEIAFDAWNGMVLGKGDVLLRPHEGTLWQVSAPARPTPRCVGDTGHINYHALYQRHVSGRLQLRNDGERPRRVAVEAHGQVFEVDLAPGEMRWFD
jgi:alpha-galactosidase